MDEHGHTVMEMMIAAGIFCLLAAFAFRQVRAYAVDAHLLGAGNVFKGEFRKARSMATRSNVYTAIRFEGQGKDARYSVYRDGNYNGVRKEDILSGADVRVAGPFPLDARAPGVRVGINPGVPAIPPEKGILDTSDPIRFGPADMLSFSPLGTATPGTFYLAGEASQGAVRVTPGSARVRLMVCRNGLWVER